MGPLRGVKVVEMAGIGPAPACGMLLADLGAEVTVIERAHANPNAAGSFDTAALHKTIHHGDRSVRSDNLSTQWESHRL